ncbi:MAG TPA: hypothetical protein VNM89_02325 [Solirubrobacterales bacterium]|nr:hypothetical protein [Solirubrobacterales bacterium]
MRKGTILVGVLLALFALVGTASALRLRAGDILIIGDGGFSPRSLPRDRDAPIEIHGGGRISTISGELPPVLHRIIFDFDRHGHVETRGLQVCTRGRLIATDVPRARANCRDAIVGKGRGTAIVKFPDQNPIPASSPITLFNGPRKSGNPTLFAHAYLEVGGPTTFIVPIEIRRIRKGLYGYRVETEIPRIAGGYGIPKSGSIRVERRWTYKGKKLSYVNARCENGRLQAFGTFTFRDGTRLSGTFARTCSIRR